MRTFWRVTFRTDKQPLPPDAEWLSRQFSNRPPFPGNVFFEGFELVEVPEDRYIEKNGVPEETVKLIVEDNNKLRKDNSKLEEEIRKLREKK